MRGSTGDLWSGNLLASSAPAHAFPARAARSGPRGRGRPPPRRAIVDHAGRALRVTGRGVRVAGLGALRLHEALVVKIT